METNTQWKVLNISDLKTCPLIGQRIYKLVVNPNTKEVLIPMQEKVIRSEEQMEQWSQIPQKLFGAPVAVLWQPVPPPPVLPDAWEIVEHSTCAGDGHCQFFKEGLCAGGPKQCPEAKLTRMFKEG